MGLTMNVFYWVMVLTTGAFLVKRGGGWSNFGGLLGASLLWPVTVAVLAVVGFKVRVLGRPVDFDGPEFDVLVLLAASAVAGLLLVFVR
jgi:hypothetical protein